MLLSILPLLVFAALMLLLFSLLLFGTGGALLGWRNLSDNESFCEYGFVISFNRLFEETFFSFDKGEGFDGFVFAASVFWMLDIADLVNLSEWLSSGLTISLYV